MPLIKWRDEFLLDIPSVDHEHQALIGLINSMFAEIGDDPDPQKVQDFLGEIHSRISAHFALEEKLMREHAYDGYVEHKADHERLLDDIRDIMDDCAEGKGFEHEELARRVSEWFTDHFRTKDARMHRSLG